MRVRDFTVRLSPGRSGLTLIFKGNPDRTLIDRPFVGVL